MESIAEFLARNPYVTLTSVLVGIISLVYAIVSSIIGRKYKRITYTKKTNKIVSLKSVGVGSLHLLFNDEEITDVSITRIAVWNSGKEVIKPSDIVESRPLLVGLKEKQKNNCHILDCSIDYKSNEDNKLDFLDNEKAIQLQSSWGDLHAFSFKFLEPTDGMVIQIIHTGEAEDISMDCHIIGGKGFFEVDLNGGKIIFPKNTKASKFFSFMFVEDGQAISYSNFLMFISVVIASSLYIPLLFWFLGSNISEIYFMIEMFLVVVITFIIYKILSPFFIIRIPKKIRKVF